MLAFQKQIALYSKRPAWLAGSIPEQGLPGSSGYLGQSALRKAKAP